MTVEEIGRELAKMWVELRARVWLYDKTHGTSELKRLDDEEEKQS